VFGCAQGLDELAVRRSERRRCVAGGRPAVSRRIEAAWDRAMPFDAAVSRSPKTGCDTLLRRGAPARPDSQRKTYQAPLQQSRRLQSGQRNQDPNKRSRNYDLRRKFVSLIRASRTSSPVWSRGRFEGIDGRMALLPKGRGSTVGLGAQCLLLMLWTAPPPAHECQGCGRCLMLPRFGGNCSRARRSV
jgi:hypothetical protein